MISFSIDGTTYQAEDGMTWAEWLNSEYNIDGYKYNEEYTTISSSLGMEILKTDGSLINLNEEIVQGATYDEGHRLPV